MKYEDAIRKWVPDGSEVLDEFETDTGAQVAVFRVPYVEDMEDEKRMEGRRDHVPWNMNTSKQRIAIVRAFKLGDEVGVSVDMREVEIAEAIKTLARKAYKLKED